MIILQQLKIEHQSSSIFTLWVNLTGLDLPVTKVKLFPFLAHGAVWRWVASTMIIALQVFIYYDCRYV